MKKEKLFVGTIAQVQYVRPDLVDHFDQLPLASLGLERQRTAHIFFQKPVLANLLGQEFSSDIEPMKWGHGDWWYQKVKTFISTLP